MSNQILISSGAKLRDLDDVIIGTDGILSSLGFDVPYGVPRLDGNGKILASELPNSVMEFKGVWNAATNTPTLTNGVGNAGDVYLCNVAGTVDFGAGPITFAVGDYAVYTGSVWARSSGAVGTVTSVAVSRDGDALAITGSPITTSGTINIGFTGNSSQYINGAGNLVTFPTIISEAQNLVTEVYNETGATLTKGTVVYINGGHGNLPTVTKAIATSDATSAQTYGVVRADITNNNNGYVTVIGSLNDLDTQAYPDGTQLYLSGTTAGAWTSTKPSAPIHLVYVGIVVRSHPTQGVVEVRIQNGYELGELHDVQIIDVANNDGIFYDSATSLWKNKTIAEVLGYTPANAATTLTINGTTYDLSANRTWNVGTVTSVGLSAPTGFSVTGSPVTSSGTLALSFAAGYSLPTNIKQSNWDDAYTWVAAFPTQTGNAGKFLTTDGSTLSWATNPLGTVTSVAMSVPTGLSVAGSPITTSGTLAVTFAAGYSIPTDASQSNWDTAYTNRITSLTTTGSSGAATLISNTLNIPTYTLAGLGGVPTTRTLTINGVAQDLSADRTWTITAGISSVSGTAPISVATVSGAATVSISQATTSTNGYLSSTDWNTFNNKQNALTNPVTGTGTNNYIAKFNSTGSTIANSAIYEGLSGFVSINNTNTSYNLDVTGTGRFTGKVTSTSSDAFFVNALTSNSYISFGLNGTVYGYIGLAGSTSGIVSGSSTGDLVIRTEDKNLFLTTNNNSSYALKINASTSEATFTSSLTSLKLFVNTTSSGYNSPSILVNAQTGTSIPFQVIADGGGRLIRLYNSDYNNTNTGTSLRMGFGAASGNTYTSIQSFTSGETTTGNLILNGSGGNIAIGTVNPVGKLHVYNASSGASAYQSGNSGLTVENSGRTAINILTPAASDAYIFFSSPTSATAGYVGYDHNVNQLILKTSSTTYMVGGNVLVQTSTGVTGGGALQVNGNVNINGVFQINGVTIGGGGGSGVTGSGTAGYLSKWTTTSALGNSLLYETATGVGIGTTSVDRQFVIQGTNEAWTRVTTTATSTQNWLYGQDGSRKGFEVYDATAGLTRFFVAPSNGYVGIGTTSSEEKLHVENGSIMARQSSTTTITQIIADANGSGTLRIAMANFGSSASGSLLGIGRAANGFLYKNGGALAIGTGNANVLVFSTSDIERARFTSGGNYLIGTTTDNGYKLQVDGGGISLAYGYIFKLTGSGSDILIANTGSTMSITGAVSVSSSVTASAFYESSDSRLKQLIADNYNAVGIENVKAKLYIKDGKEELGYFAQDLENVLKSSLEINLSGYYDLSYRQVHTAKISYLENKIKELEQKLNSK